MSQIPYLLNRSGNYHFRVAVPRALMASIGRKELVYSLRTKDKAEGRARAALLGNLAQQAFEMAYRGQIEEGLLSLQEAVHKLTQDTRPILNAPYLLSRATLPSVLPAPLKKDKGIPFSEAFEAYVAECNGERPRSLLKKRAIFNLFIEAIGDLPVKEIGKAEAREFKKLLMKLPSNLKKRYKGKPLKKIDLDAIPEHQKLNITTINDLMGYLRALFNWMIRNGHYEAVNPFLGMALRDTERAIDKRLPFSQGQLKAIFSTPIFTGCKSDKLHDRYLPGDMMIKDGFYWVPLIALYSGARLQEICQLYVSDVKQIENIWVFDFNDAGPDKRLKNSSSKRKTPIHPKLIEFGLIEHSQQQKEKGEARLFSDLVLSNDGTYSNAFSKRFNHFLVRFGIKADKTSFHSFRHTFIDVLRNAGVVRETRMMLVGHLDSRSAHDQYGSIKALALLYKAISSLEYDFWSMS